MVIQNALVYGEDFRFHPQPLAFQGERITSASCDSKACDTLDGSGCYLIPGLIDIHIHGAMGFDFCNGTDEAITAMAHYLAANGITSFLPTSMTLPEENLAAIYQNASRYSYQGGAVVEGINMEGPFLSHAKKGAQNGAYLQNPDAALFHRLNQISGRQIRLVSLAPELPGAASFLREVRDEVTVAIAHTNADYDTARFALENGARHITHLFNAMPPFLHRAPGVVGAAADSLCTAELICDGIHLHGSTIRAAFRLFGDGRLALISDSMMACGLKNGSYSLGGQAVQVAGRTATLDDGTVAGSCTNQMECLRQAVAFGIPLESAIRCATAVPAKIISKEREIGSLAPGKFANMTLLSQKDLSVQAVFIRGQRFPLANA